MTDDRSKGTAPDADATPPTQSDWDDTPHVEDDIEDDYAVERDLSASAPPAEVVGQRRPPIALIASSVLLLIAIGAGLAFALPPKPVPPVTAVNPSAAASTPSPSAPTALPLPKAVGEYTSTEVIAQVGENNVTRGDFVRLYQPGGDPAELLKQMIQVELVLQEAKREGVTVNADAVTKQIADIKQAQAGGDDAKFAAFLEQAQVGSQENLRRLLERDNVVEQMILRHTTGEQAHARHILLATDAPTDTAKLAQLKSEAETLMKQLEGGADFAALAKQRSDDPGSKEKGGDLGWSLRGLFVGPFDEAVFSMKTGERRLVQTDFGWHIIELLEAPTVRPLPSTDMLQTPSGQKAFTATFIPWIEGIQKQAETDQKIKIVVPAEQLISKPVGT